MNCAKLDSIEFAEGITCIPQFLFAGCTGLKNGIVIPDTVETIKDCAFYGCSALPTVTFSSSLTEISEKAFTNCTKLTVLEFPESLTTICNNAFSGCTQLSSIDVSNEIIGQAIGFVKDGFGEGVSVVVHSVSPFGFWFAHLSFVLLLLLRI